MSSAVAIQRVGPSRSVAPEPERIDRSAAIQAAIFALTLLLVAAPVLVIGFQSLQSAPLYEPQRVWTLDGYFRLLSHPEFLEAVSNSVGLAAVATVVATTVGAFSAVAIVRFDIPGRSWLEGAMLAPIYLSQLVLALGWYVLYGPAGYVTLAVRQWFGDAPWNLTSIAGMGVLGGLAMAPVVMLFCTSSLALMDSSLEDAARSTGASPLRVVRSITLPLLRPAIVYSVLLTFVGGLEMLSIPLVFGWPAGLEFFTTFLLRESMGQAEPDYGMLGAAALTLLAIVALLVLVQQRLLAKRQRFVTVRGKSQRPKAIDIGSWRWVVFSLFLVYLTFAVALPLCALILRSFVQYLTPLMSPWSHLTLDFYRTLWEQDIYLRSIGNSLVLATVGALVATALATLITAVAQRSDFRCARQLEMLALFPRAVPGMVVGIGFLWVVLWVPGLGILHGTLAILIVAFTMRDLPTAYATIAPSFLQIGKEIDQSARVSGASWWRTCVSIVIPIARPALVSCYLILFIAFFKEYASAVFLYAPGNEIVGTTMLNVWAKGEVGPVAALSVVQLVLTLVLVVVLALIGRGLPRAVEGD